jgi:two-component system response regulator
MCAKAQLPPVLIADDDPDALFLSRRLLLKAGLKNPVVEVHGGAEAITYLRGSCPAAGAPRGAKPAAIFVDLKMPRVTGFQVLRWACRKRAFLHTWKFVLTSSDHPRDRSLAEDLGVDGYLVKYPSVADLAELVERIRTPADRRLAKAAAKWAV